MNAMWHNMYKARQTEMEKNSILSLDKAKTLCYNVQNRN